MERSCLLFWFMIKWKANVWSGRKELRMHAREKVGCMVVYGGFGWGCLWKRSWEFMCVWWFWSSVFRRRSAFFWWILLWGILMWFWMTIPGAMIFRRLWSRRAGPLRIISGTAAGKTGNSMKWPAKGQSWVSDSFPMTTAWSGRSAMDGHGVCAMPMRSIKAPGTNLFCGIRETGSILRVCIKFMPCRDI